MKVKTIAALCGLLACIDVAVARPVPRPAMADRLKNGPEIIGIVHWGLNTYTDREWGYGDEDPAMLNPAGFDADQIVEALKGFKVLEDALFAHRLSATTESGETDTAKWMTDVDP